MLTRLRQRTARRGRTLCSQAALGSGRSITTGGSRGSDSRRRVKTSKDGIPIVAITAPLLVAASRSRAAGRRGGLDKVKAALVSKGGRLALCLAGRWAAIEDGVEIINAGTRNVSKAFLISRTLLGVLQALKVIIVIEGILGRRGVRRSSLAGSWNRTSGG